MYMCLYICVDVCFLCGVGIMEPMDIVGRTKEDASLPKGLFILLLLLCCCDFICFLLKILFFEMFLLIDW